MGFCNLDSVRVFKVRDEYKSWVELTKEANKLIDDIDDDMTTATQNANTAKTAANTAKTAAYSGAMSVGDKIRWIKFTDTDGDLTEPFVGRFVLAGNGPALDISRSVSGEEEAALLREAFKTTQYVNESH